MFRRLIQASVVALSILFGPLVASAEPIMPAAQWVPQDAVLPWRSRNPRLCWIWSSIPDDPDCHVDADLSKAAKRQNSASFLPEFLSSKLGWMFRGRRPCTSCSTAALLLSVHPGSGVC